MKQESKKVFEKIISECQNDNNILGMFLGGSRGKGFENDNSDYDIRIIVKDETVLGYGAKYPKYFSPGIDVAVISFSEFQNYARWGSDTAWDRYEFFRGKAMVDKNGLVQKMIDEKGSLPASEKENYINGQMDAYLNCFIRSVESFAKNDAIGNRLQAAISLPCLINAIFAAEDRVAPFVDYLEKELDRYPLEKFPLPAKDLLSLIIKILDTGSLSEQRTLETVVEKYFRSIGFGLVFDDWGARLPQAVMIRQ